MLFFYIQVVNKRRLLRPFEIFFSGTYLEMQLHYAHVQLGVADH